jgi:uncharacterized protein YyaL (SSP411 family)
VDIQRKVYESVTRLGNWVERNSYRGYEPFDGLSSPLRPLTFGNLFLERILMQIVRQSPINLRPLLGITKKESTKGRGYMAWGYLAMHQATGEPAYREKAIECLDWLDRNKARKYRHHSWSNHFDFSGRGGSYSKNDPIIVWTSLIGQAYIKAYETLGDRQFLDIAESVCRWILDLPREKTSTGNCLSYLAHVQSSIHNSNMLGASMLARTYKHTQNKDYMEVARSAMEYSCSRQMADGSWWYGEDPKYHWIDNFHTGYNLDSLRIYGESVGDSAFEDNLRRGFNFFMESFVEKSGRPKYYHNRAYPIDSQCAAQTIDTLSNFAESDERALDLAVKVANWTIDNMQDERGYFYYRQYPLLKAKTPMLHWAQATTYKALASLMFHLIRRKES